MEALIAFGIVITLALGAVRMGTLALQRTGLSRESASFQAQSAFMGVGFTTSESETVVNHPVRRRVLRMLMWGGYSGITVTVSTIVSGVGSSDGHLLRFLGLMLVTAGVLAGEGGVPKAGRHGGEGGSGRPLGCAGPGSTRFGEGARVPRGDGIRRTPSC